MKSAEEIMEILDAYDLTGSLRDAGELAGCSHHTVKHYVERRAAGGELDRAAARPQLIDEYLPKVEEWVERSRGKVRADVAHEKLLALGYKGSERTTRRAVAKIKSDYRAGQVRVHRPWVTEPGMWLQYDYGDGPVVDGVKTVLFVAWLAWSRFRVVLPIRDKTMPSVFAALDVTFRRLGGVPTYVLTDNEKTVTVEHIAGIPVRNPQLVAFAEHYSVVVHTCVPADPASKGGTESSVKISKADLVPKDTNLREEYASFAELEAACVEFCREGQHPPAPGHPAATGARCSPRNASGCTRSQRAAHGRVRHHPGGAVQHADGDASSPASTRSHTGCSVRRCGSVLTGLGTTSGSSSSTSARTGPSRSPATAGPHPAHRRSTTSTSRPSLLGRWSAGPERRTRRSRSSSTWARARGCG